MKVKASIKNDGIAIGISYKLDLKAKLLIGIFFKAFCSDKWSIQQKDSTIINFHASNNITSKFIKKKLREVEGEIDKYSIIVGGFNIPLSRGEKQARHVH